MAVTQASGVSLKPADFTHGGGLIDDVDVTIKECKFVAWDYNGNIQEPVLALGVTFVDDDGNEADQYFSAGDLKSFVPSKDGKQALPVGTKTGLNDGSNFALFLLSALNAGFPEDRLESDISIFTGMYCHIKRIPQPKRSGIADTNTSGREKTVVTIEKIHRLPWDAKKPGGMAGKSAGAPKMGGLGGTKTAAAAGGKANGQAAQSQQSAMAVDDELTVAAQGAIVDVVAEAGGSVPKARLSQLLFKQLAKDPNRNQIVNLAFKDEFLSMDGSPWSYDGTTISMEG